MPVNGNCCSSTVTPCTPTPCTADRGWSDSVLFVSTSIQYQYPGMSGFAACFRNVATNTAMHGGTSYWFKISSFTANAGFSTSDGVTWTSSSLGTVQYYTDNTYTTTAGTTSIIATITIDTTPIAAPAGTARTKCTLVTLELKTSDGNLSMYKAWANPTTAGDFTSTVDTTVDPDPQNWAWYLTSSKSNIAGTTGDPSLATVTATLQCCLSWVASGCSTAQLSGDTNLAHYPFLSEWATGQVSFSGIGYIPYAGDSAALQNYYTILAAALDGLSITLCKDQSAVGAFGQIRWFIKDCVSNATYNPTYCPYNTYLGHANDGNADRGMNVYFECTGWDDGSVAPPGNIDFDDGAGHLLSYVPLSGTRSMQDAWKNTVGSPPYTSDPPRLSGTCTTTITTGGVVTTTDTSGTLQGVPADFPV